MQKSAPTPYRPVIGITMGDPAGIGPEIILSLLSSKEICSVCIPVVIGCGAVLDAAAELIGVRNPCKRISGPGTISPESPDPLLMDLANIQIGEYSIGRISAKAGRASVEYLFRAIELAKNGDIHAIVTAPIHKEALHRAGFIYAGHTEILAERTGSTNYAMMLIGGPIRVVLVTTHIPLKEVPSRITIEGVLQKIRLADQGMRDLDFDHPRIAVAGLNPHGGEGGIFGREEQEIISPAVAQAWEQGIDVTGPLPPDTVFYQAYHGRYHAVVCMYHDQGLIPLKMIAFDSGVNVTLGLPIIRTSVDHGTAFDIAGKGTANPASLTEAVKLAVRLVRNKTG